MSEANTGKIKASHVIIALLTLIALLQAVALFHQSRRQTFPEKDQRRTGFFAQGPSAVRRTGSQGAVSRAPQAFSQGFMDQDPLEELDAMSRRMSGLMQHAFMFGSPLFQGMPQSTGFDFTPAVDLEETPNAYVLKSDLPGLEKDKINLTVKDNVLTIEGVREVTNETQDSNKGYYAQERSYGSFSRSLSLPGPVDESKISAVYTDGVLTITLPKVPGAKGAQKVAIK